MRRTEMVQNEGSRGEGMKIVERYKVGRVRKYNRIEKEIKEK